jgi:hypothetical protein
MSHYQHERHRQIDSGGESLGNPEEILYRSR